MKNSVIEQIEDSFLLENEVLVDILRDDLNGSIICGNKFHKLKYNLANAKKKGNQTLLTFGGAYSNHIVSLAKIGKENRFKTIGIIRGEETLPLNVCLKEAHDNGMELHYISRLRYKDKSTQDFIDDLRVEFGSFYLIPEGGTNYYAINGCMEIVKNPEKYDYICCPVGTGGTIAGITISNQNKSNIIGFPALKNGDFLKQDIHNHVFTVIGDDKITQDLMESLSLETRFHFGGYAKANEDLISFVQNFNRNHGIKWDLVYNGKMAFGVFQMIKEGYFKQGSKILLIHTGGVQGIRGYEERFNKTIYE